MSLCVVAYSQLKPLRIATNDDKQRGGPGLMMFADNGTRWASRMEGIDAAMIYAFKEQWDFSISYSGHGKWRDALAKLAGYPLTDDPNAQAMAEFRRQLAAKTPGIPAPDPSESSATHTAGCIDGIPGPFMELINFSDCEGTLGPVVCAKLAEDFQEFDDRAKSAWGGDSGPYAIYSNWRKAVEMAADRGAIAFC